MAVGAIPVPNRMGNLSGPSGPLVPYTLIYRSCHRTRREKVHSISLAWSDTSWHGYRRRVMVLSNLQYSEQPCLSTLADAYRSDSGDDNSSDENIPHFTVTPPAEQVYSLTSCTLSPIVRVVQPHPPSSKSHKKPQGDRI